MLLIARRYLLSPKSHSVVNIIAWVSVLSLLLPVAAVIVLLSVFNGFGVMIGEMESRLEGDLTLRLREGKLFEMSAIDVEAVRGVEGVEALSFITEQTLLVEYRGESAVVTLRGVDGEFLETVDIEDGVEYGEFSTHDGGIVMGRALVSKLGIRSLRDIEVDIYALKMGRLQSLIPTGAYTSAKGALKGILLLDQESEERYAFASQEMVNQLLGREDVASRVSIALDGDGRGNAERETERIRHAIETIVGEDFRVERREELNPAIHQIVRYEKMGVLLICSFVMLLASFSLLGALTMLIIEKSGDIETLRAIGFDRGGVARIFTLEGVLISGVAIFVGVVLGVVVTLVQQHFGVVELPSSSMASVAYPVELHIGDVIGVIAIASGIAITITLFVVNRALRGRY